MPDLSGTIDLSLPVEVGSEGTPIKWNGSNRVLIRTGSGSLEPTDPEVVSLEQTLAGEYEPAAQSLRAASHVAISRAETQLGTVELTAVMDGAKRPAVTDASLTLAGLRGDMLNLWLREAAATQVHAGRFRCRTRDARRRGSDVCAGESNRIRCPAPIRRSGSEPACRCLIAARRFVRFGHEGCHDQDPHAHHGRRRQDVLVWSAGPSGLA